MMRESSALPAQSEFLSNEYSEYSNVLLDQNAIDQNRLEAFWVSEAERQDRPELSPAHTFMLSANRWQMHSWIDSPLLRERHRRLKSEMPSLRLPPLQGQEIHYFNQIVTAGKRLEDCLAIDSSSELADYINAIKQTLTEATYFYLTYRMKGINEHLSTGNVHMMYHSQDAFRKYASDQNVAISKFINDPTVNQIMHLLEQLAPLLRYTQESAAESLAATSNPYGRVGVGFMPSPCLPALLSLLKSIEILCQGIGYNNELLQTIKNANKELGSFRDAWRVVHYCTIATLCEEIVSISLTPSEWNEAQINYWFSRIAKLLNVIQEYIPLKDRTKPWDNLYQAGLLVWHHATKFHHPNHKTILLDAASELIAELKQQLMPYVKTWYLAAVSVVIDTPQPLKQAIHLTPTLDMLAAYTADFACLHKMQEIMQGFHTQSRIFPESIICAINVLGECAKNISSTLKQRLGDYEWSKLKRLRNELHHDQTKIKQLCMLLDDSHNDLASLLVQDFATLAIRAQEILEVYEFSWEELKVFYKGNTKSSAVGAGVKQLITTIKTASKRTETAQDAVLQEHNGNIFGMDKLSSNFAQLDVTKEKAGIDKVVLYRPSMREQQFKQEIASAERLVQYLNRIRDCIIDRGGDYYSFNEVWHQHGLRLKICFYLSAMHDPIARVQETARALKSYDALLNQEEVLVNNALYRSLDMKLYRLDQDRNMIAHILDVTSNNTMTSYGSLFMPYYNLCMTVLGYSSRGSDGKLVKRLPSLLDELSSFIEHVTSLCGKNVGQENSHKKGGGNSQGSWTAKVMKTFPLAHEQAGIDI